MDGVYLPGVTHAICNFSQRTALATDLCIYALRHAGRGVKISPTLPSYNADGFRATFRKIKWDFYQAGETSL